MSISVITKSSFEGVRPMVIVTREELSSLEDIRGLIQLLADIGASVFGGHLRVELEAIDRTINIRSAPESGPGTHTYQFTLGRDHRVFADPDFAPIGKAEIVARDKITVQFTEVGRKRLKDVEQYPAGDIFAIIYRPRI